MVTEGKQPDASQGSLATGQVNLTLTLEAIDEIDSLRNGVQRTRSLVIERLIWDAKRVRQQSDEGAR